MPLSDSEFAALLFPPLSMPKRGPQGKLGSHRVLNLIVWGRYTGRQWQCLPVPTDSTGTPAMHDSPVYKVFAKGADDGALWHAFVASVAHLSAAKTLDRRLLPGDGTQPVANTGGMAWAPPATHPKKGRRASP